MMIKKTEGHIGITEFRDEIISDSKVTFWDNGSIIYFKGPRREYPNPYISKLESNTKCHIGDHLWDVEAYATIIPNRFPLCKYHFVTMFPGLKRMLRYHYGMEQPWRRTY